MLSTPKITIGPGVGEWAGSTAGSYPFLEEGDESHADVTCPIALFDDRTVASQSQSQTEASEGSDDRKGYSKNTVKARVVNRRELQPNVEEREDR
ncbi:hypothetical protein V8D89_006057 [Ganoderma adspersum]